MFQSSWFLLLVNHHRHRVALWASWSFHQGSACIWVEHSLRFCTGQVPSNGLFLKCDEPFNGSIFVISCIFARHCLIPCGVNFWIATGLVREGMMFDSVNQGFRRWCKGGKIKENQSIGTCHSGTVGVALSVISTIPVFVIAHPRKRELGATVTSYKGGCLAWPVTMKEESVCRFGMEDLDSVVEQTWFLNSVG